MAPSCPHQRRHPQTPQPETTGEKRIHGEFSFLQFPFSPPPAFSSATHGGGHVTTRIPNVRQIIFPSVGCFFPAQFMFFNGSGICEVLAVNDPCRSSASCPASHFWLLQLFFWRGQEWVQLTAAGTPRKGKLFFSCSPVVSPFPDNHGEVFQQAKVKNDQE